MGRQMLPKVLLYLQGRGFMAVPFPEVSTVRQRRGALGRLLSASHLPSAPNKPAEVACFGDTHSGPLE